MLAPPAHHRLLSLDVMRGVAVLGILAMHVVSFSMPAQAYFNPLAYGGTDPLNIGTWALTFILVDGKMRGLFTLLFGASLLLVAEGAERRCEHPASIHYRRMAWLLCFGLIHFYFIWYGDILIQFALVGMMAFLLRHLPTGRLLFAAAGLLVVHWLVAIGFAASFMFVSYKAALPMPLPDKVSDWAVLSPPFSPLPADALAADLALHRGGYWGIAEHRLTALGFGPFILLLLNGMETLAYMLLGMLGLKSGFLAGRWDSSHYRRIALLGLGLGAAGYAALAAALVMLDFHAAAIFSAWVAGSVIFRLVMVAGYCALILLLMREAGWLTRRLAAAGRVAFTNYLGASLVMTTIFYGYGLGLYGQFQRVELLVVVAAAWGLMLWWSKAWVDRYRYGPFEWLWRSLSRGRPQPMRLLATVPST